MNSKLTSLLYDEGIYNIPESEDSNHSVENLDLVTEKEDYSSYKALCLLDNTQDPNLELLQKIMSSISFSEVDYKILDVKSDIDSLNSKSIFIFTDSSFDQFTYYEWKELNDKRILKSESLDSLNADTQKKRKLWSVLKN